MEEKSNILIFDNSIHTQNTPSKPINIPCKKLISTTNKEDTDIDQYSLNLNIFNPGNMSPPDPWIGRLKSRIENFGTPTSFHN